VVQEDGKVESETVSGLYRQKDLILMLKWIFGCLGIMAAVIGISIEPCTPIDHLVREVLIGFAVICGLGFVCCIIWESEVDDDLIDRGYPAD